MVWLDRMVSATVAGASLFISAALFPVVAKAAHATPSVSAVADYGKLPISFEVNRGQSDAQVRFLSHGKGYSL